MAEVADILKSAQEFMMLAEQQLRDSEFEDAEQTAKAVTALAPRFAPAWRMLGDVLSAIPGRRAEAAAAYNKALEYDPSDKNSVIAKEALSNRATAAPTNAEKGPEIPQLAALGDKDRYIAAARSSEAAERWKEAKDYWEYVLEIDPTDTWVWSQYGHLLSVQLHDYHAAETAFRKAIDIDPTDDWVWGKLGIMISDFLGKVSEGQGLLKEAIRLDPREPYYHGWLGWSLYRQSENFAEAEICLKEATRLLPTYQWAHFHLGFVQYAMGNKIKEAKASFQQAIKLDPSDTASMFHLAALFEEQLKQPAKAINLLEKLVAVEPDHAPAHYKLALYYEDNPKTFEKAADHYRTIIEFDPNDLTARRYYGALQHEKLNAYKEAAQTYKHALQIAPDDSDLNYRLGALLGGVMERWDEAVKYLQVATELAPEVELGWASLGEAYAQTGKYKAAKKALYRAVEIDPEYYWAHKELGSLYADYIGDFDAAIDHFQTATEIEPKDTWCRIALANVLQHQLGRYDEAEQIYLLVLELDSTEITTLAELSVLYLTTYRYDDALKQAKIFLELCPDAGFPCSLVARCMRYTGGDHAEIRNLLRKGLELSRTHWNWHEYAEYLLYDIGDMEDAEEAVLTSMQYPHECSLVHADLGLIRYIQGREEEARQLFEKTLEQDPDDANAWRLYGRYLWVSGADLTITEQAFETAVEKGSNNFENWMMLSAFLETQTGREQDSKDAEIKALELAPIGLDYKKWASKEAHPFVLRDKK